MPRSYGALSLTRAATTTPDWASAAGLSYFLLAQRYSQWASGSALSGRVALVSGSLLGEIAPHFLPFPQPGWGFITSDDPAYGLTNRTLPHAVPVLSVSGSLPTDNANYPTAGGSGSSTYAADSRDVRVLRPAFVRRIV
jgi:hypothetical protein